MKAAKAEYAGGYLFNTELLITADVFGHFLEQADHLLQKNYKGPAAVIA